MSGPTRFGDYELLDRIAEGGMAEVWRARARGAAGFEKVVVVKRVLPALAARPGFADLLVREAKIAARLAHPNIVQVFELGETSGTFFIAMEYVHGRDLAHALTHRSAGEHFSTALRLWVIAEAARALDHAHRRKGDDGRPLHIVHRDVSPQNVLLAFEGAVKVADFGIARADEAGLGRGEDPTVLRGKYAYMSPEQARGEQLDRRSDVFALGIVLFEALTGQRLFRGKSPNETLSYVRAATLPALDGFGLPSPIVEILERALAPQREDRFAWIGEMHAALMSFLFRRGEPVGEPELADAMARMFPAEEHLSPNKLRVDLMKRAYDDATGPSSPGTFDVTPIPTEDRTASLPVARRSRIEVRRVAILATPVVLDTQALWAEIVDANGGSVLAPRDGLAYAAFGHVAGVERATVHAARAGLELQHRARVLGLRVDAVSLVAGPARVAEGVVLEPGDGLITRVSEILDGGASGLCCAREIVDELASTFLTSSTARGASIDGYRRRGERHLSELRASGPLLGRRAELATLVDACAAAVAGKSTAVHVHGIPGSGKTRLVAEARAVGPSLTWLAGRADEGDAARDFGILADLVSDLCGIEADSTPQERHERVDRLRILGLSVDEVRSLGELLGLAYPLPAVQRPGRSRGLEIALAVTKAIVALASDGPVGVLLEDLHHADEASLQLLPLVVRGLAVPRVVLISTRRTGAWTSLRGVSLRLGPLDAETSAKWVCLARRTPAASETATRWIAQESGGIPEWIDALVRTHPPTLAVRDDLLTCLDASAEASVEPAMRQRVSAWLDPLRRHERHVLLLAALAPSPVPALVLLAATELEPAVATRTLRRLLARGWLVARDSEAVPHAWEVLTGQWGGDDALPLPPRVWVPARLLARTIAALVEPADRARGHQRLMTAFETASSRDRESVEALAHHAARAVDRRRASDYQVRAAEAALGEGDAAQASRWWFDAATLARSEDDPTGDTSAGHLVRATEVALVGGELTEARRAVASLSELVDDRARTPLRVRAARCRAELALAEEKTGDAAKLVDVLPLLATLESTSDRVETRLVHALAAIRSGRLNGLEASLRAALEDATASGETSLAVRALAALADVAALSDRVTEADALAGEALTIAARAGASDSRAHALAAVGAVHETFGDFAAAAERFEEASSLVAGVGTRAFQHSEWTARALLAHLRANDDLAAAKCADALESAGRKRHAEPLVHLASAARAVLSAHAFPDASALRAFERGVASISASDATTWLRCEWMRIVVLGALGLADDAAFARDGACAAAIASGHLATARFLRETA